MSYDIVDANRVLQQLLDGAVPLVIVTLVDIRGSAPQIIGAKAIITENGIEWGTVGGGKIEAAAVAYAQSLLTRPQTSSHLVVWNLQTDIGMTCGGEVKLFFEVHSQTVWPIVVYGAGHVVQSLVRLLLQLNCHITCIDPRAEWLDRLPDDPKLTRILHPDPRATVADQPSHAFFVLMSQGHATDLPVLAEILTQREADYVGVIGSRQKASVLKRELKSLGIASEKLDAFLCPIGLPIGNNTPAEISISVAAQLIEKRDELAAQRKTLPSRDN